MKFADKYPSVKPIEWEGVEGIIRGRVAEPCWHCKEPTEFVDIDFQAHLCSDECQKAKWDEYCAAYKEKAE